MNATQAKNKQGFTIIEVVLVLAIAALIFLMVFIALPALQRNQRDTARKTVLGKVASAITTYQSNNRGKLPQVTGSTATTDAIAIGKYVDADPDMTAWGAPTGNIDGQYSLLAAVNSAAVPAAASSIEDNIYYVPKANCSGANGRPADIASNRKAAIVTVLENGNFSSFVCQAV